MEKNYTEMLGKLGDKFDSRFSELQRQIDVFLEQSGYDLQNVKCNDRILYHVLLDYFSDIERLKEFHDIKYTKSDKITAYLIYWLLRRKPIQLSEFNEQEKDIFVNERFCCYILINECLLTSDNTCMKLDNVGMAQFEKYVDLILYYFKYRQYNPQAIELFIESFKMGKVF